MPFEDHDIAVELEIIDATLAGEPVDPVYAELAELALLLVSDRPQATGEFTQRLDARVASRFTQAPARWPAPSAKRSRSRWLRVRRLALRPQVIGLASAAVAAAVVGVVVIAPGSGSPTGRPFSLGPALKLPAEMGGASKSSNGASSSASAGDSLAVTPTPTTASGQKITQSAQLQLSTPAKRINLVAQELFNVVGQESGIVESSNVTSGNAGDSYASFTLDIPTGNLEPAMTRLSELHYASVSSRTDSTQDVTNAYKDDQSRLADERALRNSLLRQLESADTQAQIDSLNTQINNAQKAITADETALAKLQRKITYSSVQVQVNAAAIVVASRHASGMTLGRAVHDAGHVLVFAAGVALIALAVLIPLALLAAIMTLAVVRWRRASRERALDRT